jgi:hypothetical protein
MRHVCVLLALGLAVGPVGAVGQTGPDLPGQSGNAFVHYCPAVLGDIHGRLLLTLWIG